MSILNKGLVIVAMLLSSLLYGQEKLTEKDLVLLIDQEKDIPNIASLRARLYGEELQLATSQSQYTVSGFAQGAYSKTNEQALATGFPVYSPIQSLQLGVTKKGQKGWEAKAYGFSTSQDFTSFSGGQLKNRTQAGVTLELTVDLWKDLLGKTSENGVLALSAMREMAKKTFVIEKNNLKLQARKLYWSYSANQDSQEITLKLLDSAKKQLSNAKKRAKRNVFDRSDVARYEAQLSNRASELALLKFEANQIIKALNNLLPVTVGKELLINKSIKDLAAKNLLSCTERIARTPKAPKEETLFDELAELTLQRSKFEQKRNEVLSDMDVKLLTSYGVVGVGKGVGGAKDDIDEQDRSRYSVGLNLSIPFGEAPHNREKFALALEKSKSFGERKAYLDRMENLHIETLKNVALLKEALVYQSGSTKALQIRVKEQDKKFRQGRISVTELTKDQDDYLASEIGVIRTKLVTINTLLDYFSVFNTYKCNFNL